MENNRRDVMDGLKRAAIVAAAGSLFGCAGTGAPPAPRPLAYAVPSPATAVYRTTDSMTVEIVAPTGSIDVTGGSDVALALAFERIPSGLRVTGDVEAFEASMSNPLTGTQEADGADLTGSFELALDRRGRVEVVSLPELPGAQAQLAPFSSIARALFPVLPDGAAEPGAQWSDTATWTTEAGAEMTTTSATTYTMAGDTVLAGRVLLRLRTVSENRVEGTMDNLAQSFSGSSTGFVLWDRERGLPVYRQEERSWSGEASAPGMPALPMTVEGVARAWLVGGPAEPPPGS